MIRHEIRKKRPRERRRRFHLDKIGLNRDIPQLRLPHLRANVPPPQCSRWRISPISGAETFEAIRHKPHRSGKTSLHQPRMRLARLREILTAHHDMPDFRVLGGEMIDVLRREQLVVAYLSSRGQADVLQQNRIAAKSSISFIFDFKSKEPRVTIGMKRTSAAKLDAVVLAI